MAGQTVILSEAPIDTSETFAQFSKLNSHLGAIASFTGIVRADDGRIDYLYLDWYPGMSEASLQVIADAAAQTFAIESLYICHRCGHVAAGETVVFVAAASQHRRAAFEAVDYMMDRLKSEAALWKREVGEDLNHWIEPTARDGEDLKRWRPKND